MSQEIRLEKTKTQKWMISEIIERELVVPRYQPIISLKRKALIGFEGLSRGLHPESQAIIPPLDLFAQASREDLTLSLDRLCRKKILEQFKVIHQIHPEVILTLNFDASIIDQGVVASEDLIQVVEAMGLDPWNICIEIIESNVDHSGELQKFVAAYREHGFLIALDDVGAGHSNLNRIPLLKPDILKIDRYLIQGIQDNFYKQQIFKSLVFLCRSLGTLIIAEGVETKEEALAVLQMGVDMIQGYYFAKPLEPHQCFEETFSEKILDLALEFKKREIQKNNDKQTHYLKHQSMIQQLQSELSRVSVNRFDHQLDHMAGRFPDVECFYVLDEDGIQVTQTFFNDVDSFHRNKLMFHPALKGTDHSFKEYYFMLVEAGFEKTNFTTEAYLSMTSGNMCVTLSTFFNDVHRKRYLLCVDIKVSPLE
jgi:EAL domain-containing protein (putative c-di-GMP-specific phosphodiesterase class I)